jgi:hypothetical protein
MAQTTERMPAKTDGRTWVHEHGSRATAIADYSPAPVGIAIRILLALAGSGLMIAGGFLEWLRSPGVNGIELGYRVYYRTGALGEEGAFFTSAGAIIGLLGILAIVGIADASGSATRFMGALGLVGYALFSVTVARADGFSYPADLGLGAWLVLVGSILAVVAGFATVRKRLETVTY